MLASPFFVPHDDSRSRHRAFRRPVPVRAGILADALWPTRYGMLPDDIRQHRATERKAHNRTSGTRSRRVGQKATAAASPSGWRPPRRAWQSLHVAVRLDLGPLRLRPLSRRFALRYLRALYLLADSLDHLGVGERGDVADVSEIRRRCDDPAHDLARSGLGHVRYDPHVLRPGDLADLGLDRGDDLRLHVRPSPVAGLERDVHLDHPAADVIDDRHRGGLGHLWYRQRCRLQFLGAEPVAGHVDDVVDATEDAEVAVLGLQRAVTGEVRPVVPVLAVRIGVVLAVVDVDEPLGLTPYRLHDAGPWVADADVAGLAAALGNLVAVLVVDDRVDAEHAWAAAAGLHRLQAGQG